MQQNDSLFELQVDAPVMDHLSETAKWAKFLSIIGFVFCGLFAIMGLFGGAVLSASLGATSDGGITQATVMILYVVLALVYFFPCLFLFHFARKMKTALRANDQQMLTDSFKNLKICYKYMGILMIIIIAFWVIGILAAIASYGI